MKKSLHKVNNAGVIPLFLMLFLMTAMLGGCEKDDLGKCTIKTSGDDLVYEEISIEECQDIFGNTVGASGWSWDPQD